MKVGKLSVSDATDLLYQNLGIRHPTQIQGQKALELVKDNDYLPLGIHAAAHALIERGKALERYSHTSTDLRLITPFLDIISGLHTQGRDEAVNLVNLLSFFTHHVPVALIRYGYKGLTEAPYNIDVLSPKYANSTRTDLDSSISILLRSGLLERTLQTWTRSSGSSSPEETRSLRRIATGPHNQTNNRQSRSITIRTLENTPPAQVTEESSGLEDLVVTRFESRGTRMSTASTQSVIDTLRIHTVVQNVIRDDLQERPLAGEHDYYWWLGASVRLLKYSYDVASDKMQKSSGAGLIRDYREYEAQAARLLSFFPKTPLNATKELRIARHEIRSVLKMARREIQNQSPSQASDSSRRLYQGSIFERSSSTSEESQSLELSSPSRASTWGVDSERAPSESPTQMHAQLQSSSEMDPMSALSDSGVLSDDGSWVSNITEVPGHALSPRSRRSSVLHAVLEGKPKIKQHKDLGEWKALPVPPSISQPSVHLSHSSSRTSSENRSSRPSSSSEAEAALAAMHRSSPPASRGGGRLRSTSRGSGERPVLVARSPNTPLSPLAAEFHSVDAAGLVKAANAARVHSRNPSSSPRLVQALLNSQAGTRARYELPPLQIENINVAYPPGRTERPPPISTYSKNVSDAETPIVRYLPSGYTSVPMSRDTSRDSDVTPSNADIGYSSYGQAYNIAGSAPHRALSDPYLLGVDGPGTYGFNLSDPVLYSDQQRDRGRQNLEFGQVGQWANIAPIEPGLGAFEGVSIEDALTLNQARKNSGEALQFGNMEPVSVEEARARANFARERSTDSSARGRSRGGMSDGERDRSH